MLDSAVVDPNFAYMLAACSMPPHGIPASFQCSGPFEYFYMTHWLIYFPLEVEPSLLSPDVKIFL